MIKLRNQTPLNLNWCISSRHEVFIRILALLQRKTSIETKNRTCLKWHYFTVRSMKILAVLTEDGAFALFFRPHPGGFESSRVPTLGKLPSKAKKMLMPRGQPGGGWAQVELTDALVQNKIIVQSETLNLFQNKPCNLFIPFPKYQYHEVIMKSV